MKSFFKKALEKKRGASLKKLPLFVVQKHRATNLHYDFRLEINHVLKSWSVPKGLPKKVLEKRLAVLTEDHDIKYADFEGVIPEGRYGAGTVKIVERGVFENMKSEPMSACFENGALKIWLKGKKVDAPYALIHLREKNWLLIRLRKR